MEYLLDCILISWAVDGELERVEYNIILKTNRVMFEMKQLQKYSVKVASVQYVDPETRIVLKNNHRVTCYFLVIYVCLSL